MSAGVEISLRIGQRVRHRDYRGQRVTGVVRSLTVESDQGLIAAVALDAPIVIPPIGDLGETRLHWQTVPAHELSPFDDRDELIAKLLEALSEALQSLEYIERNHGHHITGTLKLAEDIRRGRAAVDEATGSAA